MEKKDKFKLIGIIALTILVNYFFDLDFAVLAESGLTMSSIVLAVYIAAIVGLINTELAKKMSTTVAQSGDKTQLGVLVKYFKYATTCAIITLILSSVIVFMSQKECNYLVKVVCDVDIYKIVSCVGLIAYVGNIFFLITVIKFMLNRQIWNE